MSKIRSANTRECKTLDEIKIKILVLLASTENDFAKFIFSIVLLNHSLMLSSVKLRHLWMQPEMNTVLAKGCLCKITAVQFAVHCWWYQELSKRLQYVINIVFTGRDFHYKVVYVQEDGNDAASANISLEILESTDAGGRAIKAA